jgi:hypothetical protein
MISATIEVPSLHCTEQFDEHGNSEPYLWFAYFFADATSFQPQVEDPISVFVPEIADTRALFPEVGDNQDIDIPPEIGVFQVNLEGTALNIAMLGVLVVLMEEDETPVDAIAAGYNEFRKAVHRELNKHVRENGLVPPDDEQTKDIVEAVKSSVKDAIADELGFFEGLCDNQDDNIGFAKAIFFGDALKEPPAPKVDVFELPAIDADAFAVRFKNTFPPQFELVKVGHHHYEFVRPQLKLHRVEAVCGKQLDKLNETAVRLRALRSRVDKLKSQLAKVAQSKKPEIRKKIDDLRKNQIPRARTAYVAALGAFRDCRIRATHAGNAGVIEGRKKRA